MNVSNLIITYVSITRTYCTNIPIQWQYSLFISDGEGEHSLRCFKIVPGQSPNHVQNSPCLHVYNSHFSVYANTTTAHLDYLHTILYIHNVLLHFNLRLRRALPHLLSLAALEEAGFYHLSTACTPSLPAEDLHAPEPHTDHDVQHTGPLRDPIEDIVFRLLTWPLSSARGETTIVGLRLVIQCFGEHAAEHIRYDERVHRLCLRVVSDVIWRGEQLGLPSTYLDWLCAEGQKGCMNVLKVGCEQLLDGLGRWQEVTERKL